MNKSIFMGRLTKDPEVRYGGKDNTAIANFDIAVDRRFKRDGQPTADFFRLVSFGKQAEFVEKYLRKGTKIVAECEAQNDNYKDKNGNMIYQIKFRVDNIEFAESKKAASQNNPAQQSDSDGFMDVPDGANDDYIPFR